MSIHEVHRSHRVGWLRAAVLGANDGIVSTASLIIGVAAAGAGAYTVLLAGVAGWVAGAFSMAAGEYVSVCSQADTEKADLEIERNSLAQNPEFELQELTDIYEARGLDAGLAHTVAQQLMQHDALAAHARDEIGLSDINQSRPVLAATASALSFTVGALLPLLVILVSPENYLIGAILITCVVCLWGLGALAASLGGASLHIGGMRVMLWGVTAMTATACVGWLFQLN